MTGGEARPEALPGLVDAFIDHYRGHIAVASRPFPRVEETLLKLAGGGARLGVLTNKPQELADLLLKALKLDGHFLAIHGAGRYGYNKPDPRVFHHVTTELGGGKALMIGDSATDVATARSAGAPVILVTYGYTPQPAASLGADAVTDDFAQIPALAEKLLGDG
jgi:phosphoglycolate phosphatase